MSRHRVTAQEEIEKDPGRGSKVPEKRVRFRLDDRARDKCGAREDKDGLDGVVRIRVVMTKEELKRILSGSDRYDDLLSALRLRSRSVVISYGSGDDNGIGGNCWRPALESIPEDH